MAKWSVVILSISGQCQCGVQKYTLTWFADSDMGGKKQIRDVERDTYLWCLTLSKAIWLTGGRVTFMRWLSQYRKVIRPTVTDQHFTVCKAFLHGTSPLILTNALSSLILTTLREMLLWSPFEGGSERLWLGQNVYSQSWVWIKIF